MSAFSMDEGICPSCGSTDVYCGRAMIGGQPLTLQATVRMSPVVFEINTYVCLECRCVGFYVAEQGDISVLAKSSDWTKVETD